MIDEGGQPAELHSLAVELTTRCDQRCHYCYNAWRGSGGGGAGELTLDRLDRLLDRVLAEAPLKRLTLTGGEPFLHPDVHAMIDLVNRRELAVSLISNGGRITEDVARRLQDQWVLGVQLTLAGPQEASHDAVCGDGSFRRVLAGIESLRRAEIPVSGSFLCTAQSAARAGDVFDRFAGMGINQIAFNRFNPSGFAMSAAQALLPTRSHVLGALAEAERRGGAQGLEVSCTMPIPSCIVDEEQYPHVAFGTCSAGTLVGEPAVSPSGQLSLCTLQRHPLGNLLESSLEELLGSATARAFRGAVPEFCRGCLVAHECLGGCGAAAEWAFGTPTELDPFVAQHVMPDYAQRIGRPAEHLTDAPGFPR